MLFPTTLVGSYPQPDWLIDRRRLTENIPPRVRASDLWRLPEPWLAAAQDDATLLAIRAQEDAGIDIVTDGEIRRESYSNRFATALEGIDLEHHGVAVTRSGKRQAVPRIVGKIRRKRRSSTVSGASRRRGPVTRGTGIGLPLRFSVVPGRSRSMPCSAVAKRLE